MLTIGIDADGVLFPIEDYQLEKGKKFFHNIVDENGYGIKEVFGCSSKDEVLFWLVNTFDFNRSVVSPDGMAELLTELRKQDIKVYIITSRALADKNNLGGKIMRSELDKALKRNGIEVDGKIYASTSDMAGSKKEIIQKYKIDVMIEDRKEVVDAIKDVTNAICYETRNNRDYHDDKVVKVKNVAELREAINEVIEKKKSSRVNILHHTELANLSDEDKNKYFEELREMYKSETDIYGIEQGRLGCEKIVGSLRKLSNTVYRPHIIHPEKFPEQDGIIMAANHLHSFDPLVVLAKDMKAFHLLAKSELKLDKKFSKLFTEIGSVFVDNEDAASRTKAKEDLIKIVLNGGNIMMFPEGTRNRTEERLLNFHMGTVNIAQITKAPIIPFALNKDYKLFKNSLCVSIGDPIYVKETDSLVEKNAELKDSISSLLSEVEAYENSKNKTKIYIAK